MAHATDAEFNAWLAEQQANDTPDPEPLPPKAPPPRRPAPRRPALEQHLGDAAHEPHRRPAPPTKPPAHELTPHVPPPAAMPYASAEPAPLRGRPPAYRGLQIAGYVLIGAGLVWIAAVAVLLIVSLILGGLEAIPGVAIFGPVYAVGGLFLYAIGESVCAFRDLVQNSFR